MSSITQNTIVFFGPNEEMDVINTFISEWSQPTQRSKAQHDSFSTLKVVFDSINGPPIKQLNALYKKFPSVGNVHQIIEEDLWYKTTLIERNPSKGFRKFLIYDPYGFVNDPEFNVSEEFLGDLDNQIELRIASEMVGVTTEWINQRLGRDVNSIRTRCN